MKKFLLSNNIPLYCLGICLIIVMIGVYYWQFDEKQDLGIALIYAGAGFGEIFGAILLVMNSDIFETKYGRLLRIGIGLIIISALFKIEHWKGADLIIMMVFPLISIIYFLRFINKPKIRIGDILKMLWVLFAAIGTMMMELHLRFGQDIRQVSTFIMLFILVDFFVNKRKEPKEIWQE